VSVLDRSQATPERILARALDRETREFASFSTTNGGVH
jgi:hypothetical protein